MNADALLLALDTATDRPTFALGTAAAPGAEIAAPHRHDLSRDIERLVGALFAAAGRGPSDLEGVLVADGPGSFTGLRIGIAFAKGLCRALGVPLLAAPSLLGAAWTRCRGDGLAVAEYDALRGDVYRAVYRFAAPGVTVLAAPALARAGGGLPSGAVRAGAGDASAASLLALAVVPGAVGLVADPGPWEPDYGRPAEAEARRLARDAGR